MGRRNANTNGRAWADAAGGGWKVAYRRGWISGGGWRNWWLIAGSCCMLKYMGWTFRLLGLLVGGRGAAQEQQAWSMALPELPQGVSAKIAPLKYGKVWCYSVEMDDGGISALTMERLLAELFYTDAPPEVPGGNRRRFVGGLALIGCALARNSEALSLDDIRRLQAAGWGVVNHGYWHTGCHWDLSKRPDRAQFDREVFWSQVVLSHLFFDGGRAPAHHVYPNGDRKSVV